MSNYLALKQGKAPGEWNGSAVLWKLNKPAFVHEYDYETGTQVSKQEFEYVVTSHIGDIVTETYAFACTREATVIDWMELPGSQRGDVSHEQVIRQVCENLDRTQGGPTTVLVAFELGAEDDINTLKAYLHEGVVEHKYTGWRVQS